MDIQLYTCNQCKYKTNRESHYKRHLKTPKHLNISTYSIVKVNKSNSNININMNTHKRYECNCGRTYTHRQSLYSHKKVCNNDNKVNNNILLTLIEQNKKLQQSLVDLTKDTNIIHNTHKTFNLNIFLNETCKNAMNITDFVNSINPSITDLEETGRAGYVTGISNIILNNLKEIDIHNRPIHCGDSKREIVYVKNNNTWDKEGPNNPTLTKLIKDVTYENIKNITEWTKEHPDYSDYHSQKNNIYLNIVSNSMSGGSEEETSKNINKIITNVVREIVIDK